MTKKTYTRLTIFYLVFFAGLHAAAQVDFTAHDQVLPYNGFFHPAANIGEYPSFSEKTLGDLAAGNQILNIPGAGVKALRPGLFEDLLENFGYDINLPSFEYYESLGMSDHTVIVGFPSNQHRESEQFCPGFRSELFANLYEPIWDGGAHGTPVNEDNYYACYLWKMVTTYKDHVRFWEIWNEPGFDYTGGLGFLPPGAPGNWWDNNPDPCDYKLRAPIFHYVRLLRISWEVIKSLDPEAYVVVSGTGYPSFLDAILRNTDNPADGSPSPEFPLGGGAYFDVMGFHSYPHFDGSLQEWSDSLGGWIYSRHSDAAANGLVKTKETYLSVLHDYGYDGLTFPEKLWMVTEVNIPRKQFGEFIGSEEAQRNFMIKAMVTAMMHEFLQLHIYKLAEDTYYDQATFEFDLMGLYKRLDYNDLYFQEWTVAGVAHKTASDLLFGKTFDPVRTAALGLPGEVAGGAFRDEQGNYTYVLWAITETDRSEAASASYSFPQPLNPGKLINYRWDAGVTHEALIVEPVNISLTGTPQFFTEALFVLNSYTGCAPVELQAMTETAQGTSFSWEVTNQGNVVATSTLSQPTFFFGANGEYQITMSALNGNGQLLAQQTQTITVMAPVDPHFDYDVSGPIVHFQNLTSLGNNSFFWDFGDGTNSTDPVPTHVYLASGTYTVTLTATNACGSQSLSVSITVNSPETTNLTYTANEEVPVMQTAFRPGLSWEYASGWQDTELANLAAGNLLENVPGAGAKALRSYTGESLFLDQGYDVKKDLFQHLNNLDLRDNTFLLAFPSVGSRDPYFYCPDQQSTIFRDLYLEIWDNGENGTPINDENPWASYVYHTVLNYGPYVKFWEIYNSPDFDLTGDRGWLPPGEPGNWWDNNPDPCEYELRAPVFYYVRTLRIAYEVIKYLDEDDYVTVAGIAYPSFLDAICRNTDNPINGSISDPYPLKGGAYFDAVGFKSYPHFDGSTVFFDPAIGTFAYERHSDAAVRGIKRVKEEFQTVLINYGYDGQSMPQKEFIISETNIPRRQIANYLGGEEPQRNWTIKAWVEAVRNDIRQLNYFRLAESAVFWQAADAFQVMGFYQDLTGTAPYEQTVNEQGIALKTCTELLYATDYDPQKTSELLLPEAIDGGAFGDAGGNMIYVLWAKTNDDLSEEAQAVYSFPDHLGISQLFKHEWDYSRSGSSEIISPNGIELTGSPIFLTISEQTITAPVAAFRADTTQGCAGSYITFESISSQQPQSWEWTFPGGTPASHTGEIPPPIWYQTPGTYGVSLKVGNAAGEHTMLLENYLHIEGAPQAAFEMVIDDASIQFVNTSENATEYEWCFGDGVCTDAESPAYVYFQNGEYTVTLTAANGCGSSTFEQTINIATTPTAAFIYQFTGNCDLPQAILVDVSYSNPETWQWIIPGGIPSTSDQRYPTINFPTGGHYEVTLIAGNANGFDTLTNTIYVEGPVATNLSITLCEGDTYNGVNYFADTVVVLDLLTSGLGCDSTVTVEIQVTEQLTTEQTVEICQGEWFNGTVLMQDTVFVETLTSVGGCDSVVTTEVNVFPVVDTNLTIAILAGASITIGNQIFTEPGEYEVLLQAANGCDSVVYLNLSFWVNEQETLPPGFDLTVFPNPFHDQLNLTFSLMESQPVTVSVFDMQGRLVKTLLSEKQVHRGTHRFSWTNAILNDGLYLLKVKTAAGVFSAKILRM